MDAELDRLIDNYEKGQISRRSLLALLGAMVVSPSQAKPAGFVARSLNHVTLAVTDVEKSSAFYQSVLGTSVVSTQPHGVNLGLGDSFLGLYNMNSPPGIHHFCVGLDEFDVTASARKLKGLGLNPYVREDKPEVYFKDPDGITVQFENKAYRG